ncbi:MAG: primase-helicase zinc-binding domain-containing protein [Pseudomonadota bacterium]
MSSSSNLEEIRAAASGHWKGLLTSLGGFDDSILDGNHHPCPKCGGTDRFRAFNDFENTGGVLCNQCFSEKNSDGFAAISWLTGCSFKDAMLVVADRLGMKPRSRSSDPAKDLKFFDWSNLMARQFLARYPGITEGALLAAGAKMARFKNNETVIAFPIIGKSLNVDEPVGWILMNCIGDTLPTYNPDGTIKNRVSKKITYGSGKGLVGVQAIEKLKAAGVVELCWKCEGITDMLAVASAVPESLQPGHVVVTNSNGTAQKPLWMAEVLGAANVNVLHDADTDGQAGAKNWTQAIALKSEKEIRNVSLPYQVEEKKGKDVRDYLQEGHDYADLLSLSDATDPTAIAKTEDGELDMTKVEFPVQDAILKKLQLEVQYEDDGGRIRVFSTLLRKSSWIRNIGRLSESELIQVCGAPAKLYVSADPQEGSYTMKDVREAIALSAASKRGQNDERGVGVWQGRDDFGNLTDTIVLVNDAEGARYNGDRVLRRVIAPRADGLMLDFGAGNNSWFEFDKLKQNLQRADDPQWCIQQLEYMESIFARWKWSAPDTSPTLITGLVVASYIQTIWSWRPLISISGESNSGKSTLFKFLTGENSELGVFGNLSFNQSRSTEAGIRQGIGNTAKIILCDEFEASKERERILLLLRASTRGDTIARGTAGGQKGVKWTLRHIGWTAATESGLTKQPDLNRFIQFELKKPDEAKRNQLEVPDALDSYELGQKLLAIAVHYAIAAKQMAIELKSMAAKGIDARVVESYSVPAAMLATASGYSLDQARELLAFFLGDVVEDDQGHTDQSELLDAVLMSQIRVSAQQYTVSQMIEDRNSSQYCKTSLESHGLRLTQENDLFIHPGTVRSSLLRNTAFESKRIDQVLLRVPGATRDSQRIAGRVLRGITIPRPALKIDERDLYTNHESWGQSDQASEGFSL